MWTYRHRNSAGLRVRHALGLCLAILASAVALAACGGSSSTGENKASTSLGTVIYGSIPPEGTPVSGGTVSQGQLTGQTPTYIFPIIPGANVTTGTVSMVSNLWMPLYAGPTGAEPKVDYALSAASGPPQPSEGDTKYTIPLKENLKWSNGQPIDANDLIFEIDLLKAAIKVSPANWGQFTPGLFPENVTSVSADGKYDVVLKFNKPYNPSFVLNNQLADTNNVFPLPSTAWNIASTGGPHLDYTNAEDAKKIYEYLNKEGASVSSFASNPLWQIGSGPFKLKSFSATNSSYDLVPNPDYGGTPKARYDELQVQTFTGFTAELNAVKDGTLDIAVGIDPSQLGEASALKQEGITIFGGPSWGWFGGVINFKNTTNHFNSVIDQLYVRAAIAHLIDQPALIKGVYKGAAVEAYGPIPSAPLSPYAPADASAAPYPYNPEKAVAILKEHGWKVVPGGQTTCEKEGTGPEDCGEGIPAGTPLSFTWANQPKSVSTTGVLESEALASKAKEAAGITITLQTKTFNFLTSNYNNQNPEAVKYTNEWGVNNYGGIFMDYYPTQLGIENPGAGLNLGAFDDETANHLMEASVHSEKASAVMEEASYFEKHFPVFYFPDQDYLLAVNEKKVGGPAPGWTAMTQQQWWPQYWYQIKSS